MNRRPVQEMKCMERRYKNRNALGGGAKTELHKEKMQDQKCMTRRCMIRNALMEVQEQKLIKRRIKI